MLETGLKRSLRRADLIVTDSEFSKQEILRYFHRQRIKSEWCIVGWIPSGSIRQVRRRLQLSSSSLIKGSLFPLSGDTGTSKEPGAAAGCLSNLLAGKQHAPKLVLAGGKGWLNDELFEKLRKQNLEQQVLLTEYVPGEAICPLMCGALAFAFPSIYEDLACRRWKQWRVAFRC